MNKKVCLELTEAHLKAATKALEGFSRFFAEQETIAHEIADKTSNEELLHIAVLKKVIDQYLAYQESEGWHNISNVRFDGPMQVDEDTPKILNWEPRLFFPVSKPEAQIRLKSLRLFDGLRLGTIKDIKRYPLAWKIIKAEAPEIPRGESWTLGESPDGEGTVGVWVYKPRKNTACISSS